jgi:L-cysteine S-thiosulfotransferase
MKACRFALGLLLWTVAGAAFAVDAPPDEPPDAHRSGFDFMSPSTQAMQRDDAQNPGMLWVRDGEALWKRPPAPGGRSCANCHADAAVSMRGVAARYPAFDAALKRPLGLGQRINQCRQTQQQVPPLAPESAELLGLESYVAHQSRGLPVVAGSDARVEPFRERGRALYLQRLGQLDLSCALCHDEHAGRRLGGSVIPPAHPTGYPAYRLEWQALGSLQRRLRNCMTGMRAEPFAYGAAELIELELYLAQRAAGMRIETPAVRP